MSDNNHENEVLEILAMRLRNERRRKKWTQKVIADKLKVHVTTYSKWEVGKRYPGYYQLTRIASILEVDIGRLFPFDRAALGMPEKDLILIAAEEQSSRSQDLVRKDLVGKVVQIVSDWDEGSLNDLLNWCSGYDQALKHKEKQ